MTDPRPPRGTVDAHQHPVPHGSLPGTDVVEVSVIAERDTPHSGVLPAAVTLDHLAELVARADRAGIPRTAAVLFEDTGPHVYRGRVRVTGAGVRAPLADLLPSAARVGGDSVDYASMVCTREGCGHTVFTHHAALPDGSDDDTDCGVPSCDCTAFLDPALVAAHEAIQQVAMQWSDAWWAEVCSCQRGGQHGGHRRRDHDEGTGRCLVSGCGCASVYATGPNLAAEDEANAERSGLRETAQERDRRYRRAARAESWAEGFEAAADWLAINPGPAGGHTDPPPNPYLGKDGPAHDPGMAERLVQRSAAGLAPEAVCDRDGCGHQYVDHNGTVADGRACLVGACTCPGFIAGGG